MSEPETRVRACCVFHGRVQGVFFRAHTEAYAVSAHLTGWVRNLPDGTVEALFEGRKEDILAVSHRCRFFFFKQKTAYEID